MERKVFNFAGALTVLPALVLLLLSCDLNRDDEEKNKEKITGGKPTTELILNTWAQGELTSGGEQWYKFTATADTQYIHVSFGTLTSLYVQLRNSAGNTSGDQKIIGYPYSSTSTNLSVISGNEYYIQVWPTSYGSGSGSYKIGFTTSEDVSPGHVDAMASATVLTANSWTNGDLASNRSQWYKFTATAETQYIHVSFGTLTSLYVQLRNSAGNISGDQKIIGYPYSSTSTNLSVISGNEYYIQVWPSGYGSSSGSYKIGFTTSEDVSPGHVDAMASATVLTANSWTNGDLASNRSQWYKFTATAETQYIHVSFNTLTSLYVQLRNSAGNTSGDQKIIGYPYSSTSTNLSVISGNEYYIQVWPSGYGSGSGSYKIGFTMSSTPPSE